MAIYSDNPKQLYQLHWISLFEIAVSLWSLTASISLAVRAHSGRERHTEGTTAYSSSWVRVWIYKSASSVVTAWKRGFVQSHTRKSAVFGQSAFFMLTASHCYNVNLERREERYT